MGAFYLESMLTFETVFQRFGESSRGPSLGASRQFTLCHKPLSYSGVFKDFSWINNIFSCSKGKESVKEKPFAGFSFALSEADNPPAGGDCCKQPLAPNKRGHLSMSSFVWCGRWDLNPYVIQHTPLKRACLPIPALPRIQLVHLGCNVTIISKNRPCVKGFGEKTFKKACEGKQAKNPCKNAPG